MVKHLEEKLSSHTEILTKVVERVTLEKEQASGKTPKMKSP